MSKSKMIFFNGIDEIYENTDNLYLEIRKINRILLALGSSNSFAYKDFYEEIKIAFYWKKVKEEIRPNLEIEHKKTERYINVLNSILNRLEIEIYVQIQRVPQQLIKWKLEE